MKHIILILLSSIIAISAAAQTELRQDGIIYNLYDSSPRYAEVSGNYLSGVTNLIIPQSVNYNGVDYSVTKIGDEAFEFCNYLKSVTIPNSVTTIGDNAFSYCKNITSVTIPNSVTTIGDEAFSSCDSLISVTIPANISSVGAKTFGYCENLMEILVDSSNEYYCSVEGCLYDIDKTLIISCPGGKSGSFNIPGTVERIGDTAFAGCNNLTSVSIPNSVTTIGDYAFADCRGLTSVTIPNSVMTIGDCAFGNCSGLTSVTIPNSVTKIGDYAFFFCSGLTSVTTPNSVTKIGDYAFSFCSGLTLVTIAANVSSIGSNPFGYCEDLMEILVDSSNEYYCSMEGCLYDIDKTLIISCPGGKSGSFNIPGTVVRIGDTAFAVCNNLTSVSIPNSVTTIGDYAFADCRGLTSVTIPDSVKTIGEHAFSDCSGLTSVTIPNSVTTIGKFAFCNCSGLTSMTIPNSVMTIGEFAFSNCSGLTSVTIPNSVTTIEVGSFYFCRSISSITYATTDPIQIDYNIFDSIYDTATLYVAIGGMENAKNKSPWAKFKNILELPKVEVPSIALSKSDAGNSVIITHSDPEAKIWYSINEPDPDKMNLYNTPFSILGNFTLYAQARKDGVDPSEIVIKSVTDQQLLKPTIVHKDDCISITHPVDGVTVYYTFNESQASTTADIKSRGIKHDGEDIPFRHNGFIAAFATYQDVDIEDSDIESMRVTDYKIDKPEIKFNNRSVVITQSAEKGVTTRYTLDKSEPSEDSPVYDEQSPITLTSNATVRARSYKADWNPSLIADFEYIHQDYVVKKPEISVEESSVSISCPDGTASIYYSIDDSNAKNMQPYEGAFKMDWNSTIYAQARKEGYFDSEVTSRPISDNCLAAPIVIHENDYVTISHERNDVTIYWTDNEEVAFKVPTLLSEGKAYDGKPIHFPHNGLVAAVAVHNEGKIDDSPIKAITIDTYRVPDVMFAYNGRYVTVNCPDANATLAYVLDDGNNQKVLEYTVPFDLGGLRSVTATATREGYTESIKTFSPKFYANDAFAETKEEGQLANAFAWADESALLGIERFAIRGHLDSQDYSFIRSMEGLMHLDLFEVVSESIPDKALASMDIVSVSLPSALTAYGKKILTGNSELCAVTLNGTTKIERATFDGLVNPNLLCYLSDSYQQNNGTSVADLDWLTNIVTSTGNVTNLTLTDGYPFYAPKAFTASTAKYVKNFSKETALGGSQGWETISLPFDVQEVSHGGYALKPFASYSSQEGTKPFWLYSAGGTDWRKSDKIEAYTPYIISMPNNPRYSDKYNTSGDVTFSSRNVTVDATMESEGCEFYAGCALWPNFSAVSKDLGLYVINQGWYEDEAPGAVFVAGDHDVMPFECYATSGTARKALPIFGSSGVEGIEDLGEEMDIWSEDGDIFIASPYDVTLSIYDLTGQRVRVVNVSGGILHRESGLTPGVYLVKDRKVLVK